MCHASSNERLLISLLIGQSEAFLIGKSVSVTRELFEVPTVESCRETRAQKSELERIEEAERQKSTLQEDALIGRVDEVDDVVNTVSIEKGKIATYQDETSTEKWGGQVIVTTTLASMSDASDEELQIVKVKQSVDKRQRYAGDVSKFINRMKGSLPAKKKTTRSQPRKGNHGAANMSGIGGAANLKLAKKALSKVQAKVGVPEGGKGRGKRRRK
ncbi:Nucleolar protein 12 (25kDa) [Fragilaria crotonensis]|nr:Nucleolar protein 12 (25kDa) [Fragilaria crotonensis]